MADDTKLVTLAEAFVRDQAKDCEPGHDFWHAFRVRAHALEIQRTAGGNRLLVELTALLHDISDYKFNGGNAALGPELAHRFLVRAGASHTLADDVAHAIFALGYEGPQQTNSDLSLEQAVVRDADRLDALGAIGVARAFTFGGHCQRALFDPDVLPELSMTREQYRSNAGPTINHFFEKLLLLKERMLTQAGRELAEERHAVLAAFVQQFLNECFACLPHAAWQNWLAQNASRFHGSERADGRRT